MTRATYHVRCHDAQDAEAAMAALAVDLDDGLGGSRVAVAIDAADAAVVVLTIDSDEVGHLRAATNSFLKRLLAAEATLSAARGEGH